MILLKSALINDFDLPRSLNGERLIKEEVAYWGFFNDVLFTGELPSIEEIIIFFLFINHWGWMLTLPLRGFYQTLLGKFCFTTLEGATSVSWTHRGVHLWYWIYLRFSWRSLLTEEYSWWFLVHLGMFSAFDLLGIFLMVLICWGMILMLLIHRRCFWCMLIQ